MSVNFAPNPPAALAVPLQVTLSRGEDPGNPEGALYRLGIRFLLLDANGVPVSVPIQITIPSTKVGREPLRLVFEPARGDEVDLFPLATTEQRQLAINFLTACEALIASALAVQPAAPKIKSVDWQAPRAEKDRHRATVVVRSAPPARPKRPEGQETEEE